MINSRYTVHQNNTSEGMVIHMTMGAYIRQLRRQKDMTQEELGQKLDPPVNRAAVNKWESDQVTNIKRRHIEQMAKMFDVTPSELMCFTLEEKLSGESMTIELVQKNFGDQAVRLLSYFTKLNSIGKEKALEDLDDLSSLSKYNNEGGSK